MRTRSTRRCSGSATALVISHTGRTRSSLRSSNPQLRCPGHRTPRFFSAPLLRLVDIAGYGDGETPSEPGRWPPALPKISVIDAALYVALANRHPKKLLRGRIDDLNALLEGKNVSALAVAWKARAVDPPAHPIHVSTSSLERAMISLNVRCSTNAGGAGTLWSTSTPAYEYDRHRTGRAPVVLNALDPLSDVARARLLAQSRALLLGDAMSSLFPGFDGGNSPLEYPS